MSLSSPAPAGDRSRLRALSADGHQVVVGDLREVEIAQVAAGAGSVPVRAVLVPESSVGLRDTLGVHVANVSGYTYVGQVPHHLSDSYLAALEPLHSNGWFGTCPARIWGAGGPSGKAWSLDLHLASPDRLLLENVHDETLLLAAERTVLVNVDEEHRTTLGRYTLSDQGRSRVAADLVPTEGDSSLFTTSRAVEVRIDDQAAGRLPTEVAKRYLPLFDAILARNGRLLCEAVVAQNSEGIRLGLRLPSLTTPFTWAAPQLALPAVPAEPPRPPGSPEEASTGASDSGSADAVDRYFSIGNGRWIGRRRRHRLLRIVAATIGAVVVVAGTSLAGIVLLSRPAEDAPPPGNAGAAMYDQVVEVIDGDTAVVQRSFGNVTVRLLGIDAPSEGPPAECWADESTKFARQLLLGRQVRFEPDPTQDAVDVEGRTLTYLVLPDGTDFSTAAALAGAARAFNPDGPVSKQQQILDAQHQAEAAGRGLWGSDCTPVSPTSETTAPPSPGARSANPSTPRR